MNEQLRSEYIGQPLDDARISSFVTGKGRYTSMTSRCRACCIWRCCDRRTPTP